MSSSFIYFIQNVETKRIKIGYSGVSPESRLSALQTGSDAPLVLLGFIGEPRSSESKIHSYFSEQRVIGEWFSSEVYDEVMEIINEGSVAWKSKRRMNDFGSVDFSDMQSLKRHLNVLKEHAYRHSKNAGPETFEHLKKMVHHLGMASDMARYTAETESRSRLENEDDDNTKS